MVCWNKRRGDLKVWNLAGWVRIVMVPLAEMFAAATALRAHTLVVQPHQWPILITRAAFIANIKLYVGWLAKDALIYL